MTTSIPDFRAFEAEWETIIAPPVLATIFGKEADEPEVVGITPAPREFVESTVREAIKKIERKRPSGMTVKAGLLKIGACFYCDLLRMTGIVLSQAGDQVEVQTSTGVTCSIESSHRVIPLTEEEFTEKENEMRTS